MKYLKAVEGEWFECGWNRFRLMCCDCGLVHEMDFKIEPHRVPAGMGYRLFMKAKRNERATSASRRKGKHDEV